MTAKVGSLNVDLTLETARFQKGIKGAQQELTLFQKGIGKIGGAIAGAFAISAISDAVVTLRDMTREATNTVGALGEQAAQLGVNTDALQEYRYAASQAGIEQDQMDMALAQLTRRLGDAAQGAKAPADALARLGISLRDNEGNVRTAADTIPLIAEALKTVPSEAEKAAILVDLFGKSGQKLLPLLNEGAQGIKNLTDAAREMGLVLTPEEIANADKYGDAMDALDKKVSAQLAAKLAKNAEGLYKFELALANSKIALIDSAVAFQGWVEKIRDGSWKDRAIAALQFWNAAWMGVPAQIATVTQKIVETVKRMVSQIASAITGQLSRIWDGAIAKIQRVKAAFYDMWNAVTKNSYVPDMVDDIAREMNRLDTVMVDPAVKATAKVKSAFMKLRDELQPIMERLFPEAKALADYQVLAEKLDRAIDAGGAGGFSADQLAEAKRRATLELAGVSANDNVPIADMDVAPLEIDPDDIARRINGIGEATAKVRESFMSLKEAGSIAFGELSHQLTGVLLGAQSLGDAIRNLIGRLAELALNAAFKALGSSLGLSIPGFAKGTNFAPGGLALVGEKGPELVNLPRGSQVIPNHELAGMGRGSQPITFNLYGVNGEKAGREAASQIAMRLRHSLNPV